MANRLDRADLIDVFLKQATEQEIREALSNWNDTLRMWRGPGEGRKAARVECAAVVDRLSEALEPRQS